MKRILPLVLALLLAVSLFMALNISVAAAETDAPAALEVYTMTGSTGTPVLAKAYSAAALDALKETKADGYAYASYKGGAETAIVATEYVTLDALLADAGVSFAAGDRLSFNCFDGLYQYGDFSYEIMARRGIDPSGEPVPTAFAITYAKGSLAENSVADIAKTAANSGALRFVSGMTIEESEEKAIAGERMPSGVISMTVIKAPAALEVYTQSGDEGTPVLTKAYSAAALEALKETKTDGCAYIFYKGEEENAIVATEYVTLDTLLADAGVSFAAGDRLSFNCFDGLYPYGDFRYEAMAQRGVDSSGAPVPTAFAVTYAKGSLTEMSVADIAKAAENNGVLRFVSGMTAEEKDGNTASGERMPFGVASVTVVSPSANAK